MSDIEQGEGDRTLRAIAGEIFRDWTTMSNRGENHPAYPYVAAMRGLEKVTDRYALDSGDDIVRRFLSNAGGWRGETAKRVKAELKGMVGIK
jgi:hypothetical protein